jgi:hypothetical protein
MKRLTGIRQSCKPGADVVDSLAHDVACARKKGALNPFIFVELSKFLPYWASGGECDAQRSDDDGDSYSRVAQDLAKALGAAPTARRQLTPLQWSICFDRYSLAAVATGQLDFACALAHKNVCMEVAMRATHKGRRQWLSIVYDEVVRKEWSERSLHESGFDANAVACELSESMLLRAEARYDDLSVSKRDDVKRDLKRQWQKPWDSQWQQQSSGKFQKTHDRRAQWGQGKRW